MYLLSVHSYNLVFATCQMVAIRSSPAEGTGVRVGLFLFLPTYELPKWTSFEPSNFLLGAFQKLPELVHFYPRLLRRP